MPLARTFALVFVPCVALAAACASPGPRACANGEKEMIAENLYFGTSGAQVSPDDWRAFLDESVTPRFPRGLSVWQAAGQWQSAAGPIVRERSYILNIVHESSAPADASIAEIMKAYKARFRQEAVLRVRSLACASF